MDMEKIQKEGNYRTVRQPVLIWMNIFTFTTAIWMNVYYLVIYLVLIKWSQLAEVSPPIRYFNPITLKEDGTDYSKLLDQFEDNRAIFATAAHVQVLKAIFHLLLIIAITSLKAFAIKSMLLLLVIAMIIDVVFCVWVSVLTSWIWFWASLIGFLSFIVFGYFMFQVRNYYKFLESNNEMVKSGEIKPWLKW